MPDKSNSENQTETKPKKQFGKGLFNGLVDVVSLPSKIMDKINVFRHGSEALDRKANEADNHDQNVKEGFLKVGSKVLSVAGAAAEGMVHGPQAAAEAGISQTIGVVGHEILGTDTAIQNMSKAGYGSKTALKYEFKDFQEKYVAERQQNMTVGRAFGDLGRSLVGVADDESVSIKSFKEMKFSGGSMDEFHKLNDIAEKAGHYGTTVLTDYIEYKQVAQTHAGNAKGTLGLEGALKKGGNIDAYTEHLKNNTLGDYDKELNNSMHEAQKEQAKSEKTIKEDIQKAGGSYREFVELREIAKKSPYGASVDEIDYQEYSKDIKANPGLLKNAKGHITLKEAIAKGGDIGTYHSNLTRNTLSEYEQDLKADMHAQDQEKAEKQKARDEAYGTQPKAKKTAEAEPQAIHPESASPIPEAARQQALAQAQKLGQSKVGMTQDSSAQGVPEQNPPTVANRAVPTQESGQVLA